MTLKISNQYDEFYGVYVYKEPLIYNKIDNYNNRWHREKAYKRDSRLRTYITKLDEEIFTELPIFEPDILNAEVEMLSEEDEAGVKDYFSKNTQLGIEYTPEKTTIAQDWQAESWSAMWVKIFDTARVHKWCIVRLYKTAPYWRVFGEMETRYIEYNDDVVPISAKVEVFQHLPYARTRILRFKDEFNFGEGSNALFINFGKPEGRFMNSDDIEHIWDDSVALRYIKADITRNSAKSSGFLFMKLGKGANPQHKQKIQATVQKANYSNVVAAPESMVVDIVDIHPKNAKFSIEAFDKVLKSFAGGCRLPLSFFNSESEEGGIGTENKTESDILVNKKKKFIFGRFKTAMLKLVEMRWGEICTDVSPNLEEYEDDTELKEEDNVTDDKKDKKQTKKDKKNEKNKRTNGKE